MQFETFMYAALTAPVRPHVTATPQTCGITTTAGDASMQWRWAFSMGKSMCLRVQTIEEE